MRTTLGLRRSMRRVCQADAVLKRCRVSVTVFATRGRARHVQGSKWNCAVGDPVCTSRLADAGTVVPVPDAEGCAEVLGRCNSFGAEG